MGNDSALSGVLVLDLSRLLPGPLCTLWMAVMGAQVTKIEDPIGGDYLRHWPPLGPDGVSTMFTALNAGKHSVAIDLRQAAGREALLKLAEGADVLVESFRPGVMDRLGIGRDVLRERNDSLVVCSITGYGQDGPYRDRPGHDINFVGLAGMLGSNDTALPQMQVADIGGGALTALAAILAALLERERTGRARYCDIAMLDGLLAWQIAHLARIAGPADGNILDGQHPCYALYRCADGLLTVAAIEPKFWTELLTVLGLRHLHDEAFATGQRAITVHDEIEATLRTHTRTEWRELFSGHDVCVEPVNSLGEVRDDPQVHHRWPDHAIMPPALFGAAAMAAAPGHGEQTREILTKVGYDAAALDAMRSQGVTR